MFSGAVIQRQLVMTFNPVQPPLDLTILLQIFKQLSL